MQVVIAIEDEGQIEDLEEGERQTALAIDVDAAAPGFGPVGRVSGRGICPRETIVCGCWLGATRQNR